MSDDHYQIVLRLCEETVSLKERKHALAQFAVANGWQPSDQMEEYPGTESVANGHLLVEHGLDNTAVITFLKRLSPFSGLSTRDATRLLSISYNNLVDWHLFPDPTGVTVVSNRTTPPQPSHVPRSSLSDVWRVECFDKLTEKHPNPNIKPLDDALIATISYWKRMLYAELATNASNASISSLFNHILFVRALEDHRRSKVFNDRRLMLDVLDNVRGQRKGLKDFFTACLAKLDVRGLPKVLLDGEHDISTFDALDRQTLRRILRDFYENKFAPYEYDFSLISRHAMSRIYEHYVSILREKDSPQLRLFADLPDEISSHSVGGIYTPQYIARFFSRFLKENLAPRAFREMKSLDPACGSGIFLRTTLEMQCDPHQDMCSSDAIERAFRNVVGIDIDPSACQAASLSLSLLHLVLTGKIPDTLDIRNEDILKHISGEGLGIETFDAVMANPPFIGWDQLPAAVRERVNAYMKGFTKGKTDLFLAILRLGLELVKPEGYLLYVLPHSFLLAENAERLRQRISEEFWIRFLVDLSEVPVFGETGIYVILLILQKKSVNLPYPGPVTVVRCREMVGRALQDALEGKNVSSDFYDVFEMDQTGLSKESWRVLPPVESRLLAKLRRFPALEEFLEIREGMVTGCDPVFIVGLGEIPKGEGEIWAPLITDREMLRYGIPSKVSKAVLFPFVKGQRLSTEELRRDYPKTWRYLEDHRDTLETRRSIRRSKTHPWWAPIWPRNPEVMLRPKIVTPHLVLFPKFGLDSEGRYAVSHGPFLYPKEMREDHELLRYMLAVLNSSVTYWQIANNSHKYSRGYFMLEPKTLCTIRVPNPASVSPQVMKRLQRLVLKHLQSTGRDLDVEGELDQIVADIFGISSEERGTIGMKD